MKEEKMSSGAASNGRMSIKQKLILYVPIFLILIAFFAVYFSDVLFATRTQNSNPNYSQHIKSWMRWARRPRNLKRWWQKTFFIGQSVLKMP